MAPTLHNINKFMVNMAQKMGKDHNDLPRLVIERIDVPYWPRAVDLTPEWYIAFKVINICLSMCKPKAYTKKRKTTKRGLQ